MKILKNDRDVLQALLDGETIQQYERDLLCCEWYMTPDNNIKNTDHVYTTIPSYSKRGIAELRIKPKTININGYEVPEPLREEPEAGTIIYTGIPYRTIEGRPYGEPFYYLFIQGFLHSTKEAALLHRKALASFTTLKKKEVSITDKDHPLYFYDRLNDI